MTKTIVPLALTLIALAMPAYAQDTATPSVQETSKETSTLEISVTADAHVAPDIALISSGVITVAPTAAAAMEGNAAQMTKVRAALKKAGIADKDIQTAGISLSPQYVYKENEAPRVSGYQASNTVNVVLRDMAKAGSTLDALVSEGANQINGPTFSVEHPDKILDQARAEAVKKARKRAELYATAAGLRLKRILSITEQAEYAQPPRPMMAKYEMAGAADATTPVAPGQVELNANVTVRFELTP